MNADTKLFLALITVFGCGIALVAVGLGVTTKTALVATGVLLCLCAAKAMGILWRGGR